MGNRHNNHNGAPHLKKIDKIIVKWAYGVVVSMFDFHRSDQGSNPGCSSKIS